MTKTIKEQADKALNDVKSTLMGLSEVLTMNEAKAVRDELGIAFNTYKKYASGEISSMTMAYSIIEKCREMIARRVAITEKTEK